MRNTAAAKTEKKTEAPPTVRLSASDDSDEAKTSPDWAEVDEAWLL